MKCAVIYLVIPVYYAFKFVHGFGNRKVQVFSDNVKPADVETDLLILRANRDAKKKEYALSELLLQQAEDKGRLDTLSALRLERDTQVPPSAFQGNVPPSAMVLSTSNFNRELKNIFRLFERNSSTSSNTGTIKFELCNANIWKRERSRPAVISPLVIKVPYYLLCALLDQLFDGSPISRFYFLETVARMPYFSYITMIHTYETLGWWRRSAEAKRVHFAEEFNEYHHLLIWEALGGDQEWRVRFFAQHSAVVYYFGLIVLWLLSPSLAYNFSELM